MDKRPELTGAYTMNFWLGIVNHTNWHIVRREKILGIDERFQKLIKKIRPGDKLVFYIKGQYSTSGIYEVVGKPFKDHRAVFDIGKLKRTEIFKYRVKLREDTIPKEQIDFRQIIPQLYDLFPNKKNWGAYLQGRSMIRLSKRDFRIFQKAIVASS